MPFSNIRQVIVPILSSSLFSLFSVLTDLTRTASQVLGFIIERLLADVIFFVSLYYLLLLVSLVAYL